MALMNQTMFLKFMLFNQSRHISDEPSSIVSFSEDCFKILDSGATSFQLKIKEAMHILWEQPLLNSQVKHLNLSRSY